jgi:FkbM family methyltransferase
MTKKRNLLSNLIQCLRTWRALQQYPGLFSVSDALQNWSAVLLPARLTRWSAGRALQTEATIQEVEPGVYKVEVIGRGLVFYRLGTVDSNLHFVIDQEFNPSFPHCYTTPPIRLSSESLVLDVGACEGLFAFRLIKQGQAARVICFEPAQNSARYTRLAAEANGVAASLTVEPVAVGRHSGRVTLVQEASAPEAFHVSTTDEAVAGTSVECISLDDYCAARKLTLTPRDLIKIDAEGSDFDVLLGAERVIRAGKPQIAVTTYHKPQHVFEMVDWLRKIEPSYRLRLKGFSSWTPTPVPVLLQAA